MKNAELVEKLEQALALLQQVEAGMDDRPDLEDLAVKLANDVLPVVGMMVDEMHYSRPEPWNGPEL